MKLINLLLAIILTSNCYSQKSKISTKANYSIKHPDTWVVDKERGIGTALSINLPGDSVYDASYVENIYINIEDIKNPTLTANVYAQGAKKTLPLKIKKFKVLSEKASKINNVNSYYMIFKGTQEGTSLQWRQEYIITNGKLYILTFTADDKKFMNIAKSIETAFNTFKIK